MIQHIYEKLCVKPMLCPDHQVLFQSMHNICSQQISLYFEAELLQQSYHYGLFAQPLVLDGIGIWRKSSLNNFFKSNFTALKEKFRVNAQLVLSFTTLSFA